LTSSALPLPEDAAPGEGVVRRLHALPGRDAAPAHAPVTPADDRLVELARAGDRAAFGVLVERHHAMLAGLLRQRLGPRGPVEDLLQDVFAKSLSRLDGFGGRASFATWAGSIALNLATDWQRKQARRRRLAPPADVEQDSVPAAYTPRPSTAAETREEVERARRAIEALPLNMRLAVTLRVVEELPYETVAERLDAPVTTIRTWVSRGLRQVRSLLEVPRADA